MPSFDAKRYWETRLSEDYSCHGVGWLHAGVYFNWWLYKVRQKAFLRLMRSLGVRFSNVDVLDIGSGTGFYIERWKELGARHITGVDITEVAVGGLAAKYPDDRFFQIDIGDDISALGDRRFDFISCMDVMFHIVDDTQYATALQNVFTLLKPGGTFVFSDIFLHGETKRASYIVHRNIAMVVDLCEKAGLVVKRRRPMFVLLNEPLDSTNPLLRLYWALLIRVIRRVKTSGLVIGALLYPVELLLVSMLKESPATEIMICRRHAATAVATDTGVILYDGQCELCTAGARKLAGGVFELLSFHDDGVLERYPGLEREACMEEIKFVANDGRIFGGAAAVARILLSRHRVWGKFLLGYYLPGVRQITDRVYRWIAARRYRIGKKPAAECDTGQCRRHKPSSF